MSLFCCCRSTPTGTYTHLLVNIVAVSDPRALTQIDDIARRIITRFFLEHTELSVTDLEPHYSKFDNLQVHSRIEIAFLGKPFRFRVPDYRVYTHTNGEFFIVFDLETRLIHRFVETGVIYRPIEIERTDFMPTYEHRTSIRDRDFST